MLYWLSGFRPNSYARQEPPSAVARRTRLRAQSPDPLRGPPGGELPEGQERPPWGVSPGEGIGAAAPFVILRLALLAQDNKTGAAVHIHFRICHFQDLDNVMKEL